MTRLNLGETVVLLFLVAGHLTAPVAAFSCTGDAACQYPGCSDVSNGDGGVYTAQCQAPTPQDEGLCTYSDTANNCPDPVPCETVEGSYCDYYTLTTCNTSSCDTGQYRGPCRNDTDATCVNCDSAPEDAVHTEPGKLSPLTPQPETRTPNPETLNQVCLSTRTTASGSVGSTSSLRRRQPQTLNPNP